jgi:hypothetical protein
MSCKELKLPKEELLQNWGNANTTKVLAQFEDKLIIQP